MNKNLVKPVLLYLLLLLFLQPVISQKLFLTPEETYSEANEYMLSEEPMEALPLFFNLLQLGFNNASVNYNIGRCYLMIDGQKENAVSYFERASNKVSSAFQGTSPGEDLAPLKTWYLLGEAYRISYQFKKSIDAFGIYKDSVRNNENEVNLTDFKLSQCENAQDLMLAKVDVKTIKIDPGKNSLSNSNPLVSSDENIIFFMSKLKFYDAVMHSQKEGTEWSVPDNYTSGIKSDGDYLITGITPDGKTLFLENYDVYSKGDIYTTTYTDGTWTQVKKLNGNINTSFNETHASTSPDGKTLYFTSNRPGGIGGLDIYKSNVDADAEWGPAINLGSAVNTTFNEETPFISSGNDILYFSSQGHYNMGGYDIFFSSLSDDGKWQTPVNMGYPLNTADDDKFYFPLGNGRSGYISKYSGEVTGVFNIYKYELLGYAKPARYLVKGMVDLSDSTIPKNEILVAFIEKGKNDTLSTKKCDDKGNFNQKLPAGNFELDFSVKNRQVDKKDLLIPEYMDLSEIIFRTNLKYENIVNNIVITIKDTLNLRNILFSFNQVSLSNDEKAFMNLVSSILKKYDKISIKVNGYTDSKGSDFYNEELSLKRADEVKKILIASGISENRISTSGFGEQSPAAINNNPDGTDNVEGRKFNRRVELVLSDVPEGLIINIKEMVPLNLRSK